LRARAGCAVGGTLRPLDIVRTESLNTLDVHTRDRVLARSYCLLLSMAPMVPAAEHIYSRNLRIHHFGPRHPLLTSPWLLLAVCQTMGRGPRCVVLPRGARPRVIPRALLGCTHVLVVPWHGEPQCVAIGSLLSAVAELLLRTPLLLQEHVPASGGGGGGGGGGRGGDASSRAPAPLTSVALPVDDSPAPLPEQPAGAVDVDVTDEAAVYSAMSAATMSAAAMTVDAMTVDAGGAGGNAGSAASATAHAAALAVQRAMNLEHTIGSITMVQLPSPASKAIDDAAAHASLRWVPTALHFGLPLTDVPTVEASFRAIEQRRLFSAESLDAHARALEELLACVRRCAQMAMREDDADETDDGGSDDDDEVVFPAAPLVFDGQVLATRDLAEL
jgi:hypothetical protein